MTGVSPNQGEASVVKHGFLLNVPRFCLFCWPRVRLKEQLFFCLSAGCADTVAAAQTPDSCISLASSICYLETSDFITADQCSCTPWLSPVLSVLSLRLHINDRPRLYLIKIWQALLIIHSIVSLVSSSLHLPLSQSPSLTHPPGVHIHLHFRPSLHVQ